METLWAPWRHSYLRKIVSKGENGDCFLCRGWAQRGKDRENLVLLRGRTCFVILNRYPYNTGHLMIAPRNHTGEFPDLSRAETAELMALAQRMTVVLGRVQRAHGCNIGLNLGRAAGAGVPGHLHLHIVPRWIGDTNFMPVVGKTKVMSQSLDDVYRKLKAGLRTAGRKQ